MKHLNLTGWGAFVHPGGGGTVARVLTPDSLVPAAVAADRVCVRSQRLHAWRKDGWIDPETGVRHFLAVAAYTDTGRRLYRLGDVQKAERDTHLNPRSHRLPLAV